MFADDCAVLLRMWLSGNSLAQPYDKRGTASGKMLLKTSWQTEMAHSLSAVILTGVDEKKFRVYHDNYHRTKFTVRMLFSL